MDSEETADDEITDDEIVDAEITDDEITDDEIVDAEITEVVPGATDGPGGDIVYEASEWAGQSRALLAAMLTSNGIRHIWQGTTLIVDPDAEEQVDELIDEVQASATAALGADADKVVYEVGGWSAAMQTSLADSLAVDDIPYEWDERGDLVVYADDEERVEKILDAMPDPDDEERAGNDGLEVQAVLGVLWTATGALSKHPADAAGVTEMSDAADEIEHFALPFGFEAPIWRLIVERSTALRDLFASEDGDAVTDDEIMERAAELHAQLRAFV